MSNPVTDQVGYPLIQELSILSQGRTPVLVPQDWFYPTHSLLRPKIPASSEGVDVSGSIRSLVGVRLNKVPGQFRGWLRINQASAGVPYGVQYFGTGAGSLQITGASAAVIQTIIDNILADFVANFSWGAASQVSGQDVVEWYIDQASNKYMPPYNPPDWFQPGATLIDEIISNGSGMAGTTYQNMVCESTQCTFRVWGIPLGFDEYELIDDRVYTGYSPHVAVPVCSAGFTKLFVEVVGCDGIALPFVGPCDRDDLAEQLLSSAATALDLAESDLVNFPVGETGRLIPQQRFSVWTAPGTKGKPVRSQRMVSVNGLTQLLPWNPARTGFYVHNVGAVNVWTRWHESRSVAGYQPAINAGDRLQPNEIRTGVDCPGEALNAIDDSGPCNVWVEEW